MVGSIYNNGDKNVYYFYIRSAIINVLKTLQIKKDLFQPQTN